MADADGDEHALMRINATKTECNNSLCSAVLSCRVMEFFTHTSFVFWSNTKFVSIIGALGDGNRGGQAKSMSMQQYVDKPSEFIGNLSYRIWWYHYSLVPERGTSS